MIAVIIEVVMLIIMFTGWIAIRETRDETLRIRMLLEKLTPKQEAPEPVKAAEKTKECPECHATMPASKTSCKSCGAYVP